MDILTCKHLVVHKQQLSFVALDNQNA